MAKLLKSVNKYESYIHMYIGLVALVLGMQSELGVGAALDCAAQFTLTVKFGPLDDPFQSDRIVAGLCAGTYGLVVASNGEPSYVLRLRDSESTNRVWMNTSFAKIEDFGVWRWIITVELDEGQQKILQLGTNINIYPSKPVVYYCPQAKEYEPQAWFFIRDNLFAEMVTTFTSSSIALTTSPTTAPSTKPSAPPSEAPSTTPTQLPTPTPTQNPITSPSVSPSPLPTRPPTSIPTISPTSASPTQTPSSVPTLLLSTAPSTSPTHTPSRSSSLSPTSRGITSPPSQSPIVITNSTFAPTASPTDIVVSLLSLSSSPSSSPTLVGTGSSSSKRDPSNALPIALVVVFVIVIAIVVVVVVVYRHNHRQNNHANVDWTDFGSSHHTSPHVYHTQKYSKTVHKSGAMGDNEAPPYPLTINPISMMFNESNAYEGEGVGVVDTNMYRRDSHVINEGDVMFSVPLDGFADTSETVDGDVDVDVNNSGV